MKPYPLPASRRSSLALVAFTLALSVSAVLAAAPAPKETDLIKLLQSDAPKAEKAIACKQLAVYGSSDAVPALGALLPDAELSSWARIALEAIPGPASEAALRGALDKTSGRVRVGVINSIGVRRDPLALDALAANLKEADAQVAAAAAVALGEIGGTRAAATLQPLLASAPPEVRSAVAEGCVLCAERFMAAGEATAAVSLYDAVRAAPVPQQRRLEAIRGAILARGKAGIPLLLEELRSTNAAVVGIALRAARELPGRDVTERLAAELPKLEPARQPQLLLAIGDRTDAAALPAVLAVAETGSGTLRLVAIGILDQLGNVAALPVLLKAAADRDPALGQASMTALARLEGPTLDVALLERLGQASGRDRQVLVALAGRRRMQAALPAALASTRDTDAGVRLAAIETVGQLGAALEAEALVQLVRTSQGKDRSAAEKALMTLCSRVGAAAVPKVAPLMQDQDPTVRIVSIDVLSSMGGAEALAVVVGAVQDSDATVQDEAVRALSTWPGNWPDDTGVAEPLLALVKSAKKPAHQIQALRGYLEYLKEGKGLKQEDKLAKLVAIMPSINRPEERRLAIAVLGTVPTADSLKMLVGWTGDTAVADEVAQAILSVVASDQLTGVSREDRQAALNAVIAKTTNDSTRKKAQALLQANK